MQASGNSLIVPDFLGYTNVLTTVEDIVAAEGYMAASCQWSNIVICTLRSDCISYSLQNLHVVWGPAWWDLQGGAANCIRDGDGDCWSGGLCQKLVRHRPVLAILVLVVGAGANVEGLPEDWKACRRSRWTTAS